ncbi:MAG: hypothetical protein IJK07_04355 [Bacteroidales bacterium]|nr:hypothetical protein [Bacteroidales bacterium]
MEDNKKSKFLVVIFWLAAIGCFVFGYYNTVMGLRMFDAFGSNAGSWFLAIIPLVMVFGGYLASVKGRRKMIYLYLTGEILFFVFNLSYLYPHYLGRTLVNEEAKVLKDRLDRMPNELDAIAIKGDSLALAKLQRLREFQTNLLTEIKDRDGFGPEANLQLRNFNELAGTKYTGERTVTHNKEENERLRAEWKKKTDEGIKSFIVKLNGDDRAAEKMVNAKYELDSIVDEYGPKIDLILEENSKVSIAREDVNNNPQIKVMKELTSKLDKVANNVNSVSSTVSFIPLVSGKETIAFPKTQKLGTFEHTLISVRERLGKLDTWGVIIVCFFFDLLGPFLFYFYIREDEEDEFGSDPGVFDRPWWKRIFGIN